MTTTSDPKAPHGFPGDDDYEPGDEYADVDEFLTGSAPSVKFPAVGSFVKGTVVKATMGVQRTPQGELRTFPDGNPRRQIIVTLQTDEKLDADDDGTRRLFIKGSMTQELRRACKANNVKGLRPGDALTVTYAEDGQPTQPGLNPPKLFTVDLDPAGAGS